MKLYTFSHKGSRSPQPSHLTDKQKCLTGSSSQRSRRLAEQIDIRIVENKLVTVHV